LELDDQRTIDVPHGQNGDADWKESSDPDSAIAE
jgi:hypothetical protein